MKIKLPNDALLFGPDLIKIDNIIYICINKETEAFG